MTYNEEREINILERRLRFLLFDNQEYTLNIHLSDAVQDLNEYRDVIDIPTTIDSLRLIESEI